MDAATEEFVRSVTEAGVLLVVMFTLVVVVLIVATKSLLRRTTVNVLADSFCMRVGDVESVMKANFDVFPYEYFRQKMVEAGLSKVPLDDKMREAALEYVYGKNAED